MGAILVIIAIAVGAGWLIGGPKTAAQPTSASVVKARPISDMECGHTYQFDQIKRFGLNGRRVVNFHFGGRDRGRQPQYFVDRDVLGHSTELGRHVNRSLEYSTVTILCLSDPMVEGHKASNVVVERYWLNLRRPLVPQTVIPEGGPARQ